MARKILVLFAHPAIHRSIINRKLIRVYKEFSNVTFHDLYDNYPEFMIDTDYEQQLLMENELIVFHHPIYWYSAPPILKQWLDLVLKSGFAYGEGGNALNGKKLLSVVSTGQAKMAFSHQGVHRFKVRQFLLPFEQTAEFCGMDYLPPFVTHGPLRHVNQQKIFDYVGQLRIWLKTLSQADFDFNSILDQEYLNIEMELPQGTTRQAADAY